MEREVRWRDGLKRPIGFCEGFLSAPDRHQKTAADRVAFLQILRLHAPLRSELIVSGERPASACRRDL